MAHIKKMTDKPRTLPWLAVIHRKGHNVRKMHPTEGEAELWAGEQERSIRLTGLPMTVKDLENKFVSDIVNRYIEEVTPTKGCSVSETAVLKKFVNKQPGKALAGRSLAYVNKQDAYTYINSRLKEVKASTVRREINSIQHVFSVAKEEWGLSNLNNPFLGTKIRGKTMNRRKRRLNEGELKKLEQACTKCHGLNKLYIPLAIYLAIETGMRLQEIFNLRWKDVNFVKRRIEIRKSKTDHTSDYLGRTIPLPFMAHWYLQAIRIQMGMEDVPSKEHVFGKLSKEAFKQAWVHVKANAGIASPDKEDDELEDEEGLTFHDLRREAGSWLDDAGLTKAEHDLMMGHASRDMAGLYISSQLKSIQEKLDRHRLGKTLEKAIKLDGMTYPERLLDICSASNYHLFKTAKR